jgi:hypothetical protein
VVAGDHALAQLLHAGAVQGGAELRLAEQEGLQQRLVVGLEVRQHAQFFHRARRQVLGFVDDQQGALALVVDIAQELLQARQQVGLARAFVRQAEGRDHHAQRVVRIQVGVDDVGGDDLVGGQAVEQVAHQRGLAGTDFAGDDDEALALRQAVLEVGHGALVALAAEEEVRIGAQLEGLGGKSVVSLVHLMGSA